MVNQDGSTLPFVISYLITLAAGLLFWWPVRRQRNEPRLRDGFLIVVLFWLVLAGFGAIPFLLSVDPAMTLPDAVFESMSGLTTTGATVLTGLDNLPISLLYYRQQLQWLGGMGIIVLAVAVMPMLGIGGMQLYRAEVPGPVKDKKLTPRIKETAKALWYIYLGLTVACALAYWLAGMSAFDAIGHSFSTVAIGGFSTHDQSIGFFDSPVISGIAVVFMIVAGINFALHFSVLRARQLLTYLKDPEVRVFLGVLFSISVVALIVLTLAHTYNDPAATFWHGIFQVVSIATTTGYTTTGFHWWPSFLPIMLILMSAVGGCAGSTAGGMKIIRHPHLQTGPSRDRPTDSSQRFDSHKTWRKTGSRIGYRCCLGVFCTVHTELCDTCTGDDRHRSRPGYGFFCGYGLFEQSRSRAWCRRRKLRRNQRLREVDSVCQHAAGSVGDLHSVGTADAHLLASLIRTTEGIH